MLEKVEIVIVLNIICPSVKNILNLSTNFNSNYYFKGIFMKLVYFIFMVILLISPVQAQLYINEFMASNSSGLMDPDNGRCSTFIYF